MTPRATDEQFLSRFAAEYVGTSDPRDALMWLEEPDRPGRDGAISPQRRLRQLQASLFGPDRRPEAVADARQAQREIDEAAEAARRATESDHAGRTPKVALTGAALPWGPPATASAPRRPHRLVILGALVTVVAGLIGAAVGYGVRTGSGPVPHTTQDDVRLAMMNSAGAMVALDYFRSYPQAMPRQWQGIEDGTVFRRQTNSMTAALRISGVAGAVLVTVTCPTTPVHGYTWAIYQRGHVLTSGAGTCGRLTPEEGLLANSQGQTATLGVNVQGGDGYGVTVLQR